MSLENLRKMNKHLIYNNLERLNGIPSNVTCHEKRLNFRICSFRLSAKKCFKILQRFSKSILKRFFFAHTSRSTDNVFVSVYRHGKVAAFKDARCFALCLDLLSTNFTISPLNWTTTVAELTITFENCLLISLKIQCLRKYLFILLLPRIGAFQGCVSSIRSSSEFYFRRLALSYLLFMYFSFKCHQSIRGFKIL